MEHLLLEKIATYKISIEKAIVAAAKAFVQNKYANDKRSSFKYDLHQSYRESLQLTGGGDYCYDRFTTGFLYSLFYQGRRINTALTFSASFVADAIEKKQPIEVFDLGAGVGAVHIGLALAVQAAHDLGYALPVIRVVNIDISPFMLEYARDFLIPALRKNFSTGFHQVLAEYEAVSWTNEHDITLTNPYIVASYVFDHSDNSETVAETFSDIIKKFDPERLVLLTSWHKRDNVIGFGDTRLGKDKYVAKDLRTSFRFSGPMEIVQQYRIELSSALDTFFGKHDLVKWSVKSFYGREFKRREVRLSLAKKASSLNLYLPAIRIRRDITLSREQMKAAQPKDRPTLIMGSAGSGKSVVVTERIKNVIEKHNYGVHLRILLTTFNLALIGYLAHWMQNLLDKSKVKRVGNEFYFLESKSPNLIILNFDKLPTQLGGLEGQLKFEHDGLYDYVRKAIEEIVDEQNIDAKADARYLDHTFIYQEYVRVIYGQLALSRQQYINIQRIGRPLNPGKRAREYIFDIIQRMQELLKDGNKVLSCADTIHTRRQKFYRQLVAKEIDQFTHVFVDEFQDCTLADYQLFYGLLKDNNQLVLAGDYAQAVHLGPSVIAPRENDTFAGSETMGNWDRTGNILSGSYRLPFRITECIKPLSTYINSSRTDLSTDIIVPYKGAPPGARPILVYAKNDESMVNKLAFLHYYYQVFDFEGFGNQERKQITILEKDRALLKRLNDKYKDIAVTDTILRLKGMEKDCIVWSTRIGIKTPGDEDYFVYTILTRTRSILIIAMFDETIPRYREIVKLFPKERLMIWDEATEHYYQENILNLPAQEVLA